MQKISVLQSDSLTEMLGERFLNTSCSSSKLEQWVLKLEL
jgi:hypothetical protein